MFLSSFRTILPRRTSPPMTQWLSRRMPLPCSSVRIARLFASQRPQPAANFEQAQQDVLKLREEPDSSTKLQLYGLFKQASAGDVQGDRPGMMEFVARAKYDAWYTKRGLSKEDAQQQYIELVSRLLKEAGIDPSRGPGSGPEGAAPVPEANDNNNSSSAGGVDGLRWTRQGRVFRIELCRPDKFNALTWEMYDGLISALTEASEDKETSVTFLTGVGDYFCAGNDLSNFTRGIRGPDDLRAMADRGERVLERYVRAYIEHEKPLIALINGPAIGISVTVLALFDLVIASDRASFHTPFASLGQSPEGCSSYTFPLLMGPSKASEMLLFDRKLSAEEAEARNLVARVIPNASFRTESEKLVSALASLPPESLRLNKGLLRDVHRQALLEVNVRECALLKQRWLSAECQQALQRFMGRKSAK